MERINNGEKIIGSGEYFARKRNILISCWKYENRQMPCAACHCEILHDMHLAVRMSRLFLYSLKKKRELEYMKLVKGAQSIAYDRAPYLISSASVVGKKEGEGPIGEMFDLVGESDLFGENTWEEAESTMQREACLLAMGKAHVSQNQVRYLFGGDLLRQGIATSMGVEKLQIPMFGLYGACSTSGEALALASMSVAAGYGEYILAVTSSHFGSAEKEFRFPLSYANQRPLSAHWTVTGSGAFLVGKKESHVRISGLTVGKIVDYGLKDSQNMGACMAPAACDTIWQNLQDFGRSPEDYSRIITFLFPW